MENTVLGFELGVKIGSDLVAGAKSHTLTMTAELIETVAKEDGLAPSNRVGKKPWSVSVDGLVTSAANNGYAQLLTAYHSDDPVTLLMEGKDEVPDQTGKARVTSLEISASGGAAVATFSATFEGTSTLEIVTA
ncbi:phage tail tube protein [Xanthovirga aplysinae]|uniref:phage tail tube protein n=1 Tax=Xanthovirga aplysinae TaxID=2529853 RepID=UPI0012BB7936|nr:phage tail tube protein [Xanthovirga aplysinae]MTI32816.1 hypothetical protein [Xanthovirga aplysinae]